MSIWCSGAEVGHDVRAYFDGDDAEPMRGGEVRSYAEGFSNHYPDVAGTHERPAAIGLATIAPWCVPGHNQDGEQYACTGCGEHHDWPDVGEWLRIEVAAPESLNFWEKDAAGNPLVEEQHALVVLHEDAVRQLRDDLSAWLEQPKARPIEDAA